MKVQEQNKSKTTKYYWICISILLLAIFALLVKQQKDSSLCKIDNYSHLNPQIVCSKKSIINKKNYIEFKNTLQQFIAVNKTEKNVDEVAIYFRDLQYGPTFGINEYTPFSPASLLKLPMLISFFELYEKDSNILNTEIYFEGYNNDIRQSIQPKISAKEGVHYKISELLNLMIKYSDNNAYYALLAYQNNLSSNTQILRDTFIDLGIIDPESTVDETISVKSYSGIFTQLFNASFFSFKETSDMALEILTDTDYTKGLVAGVPKGIKVAHKFGERFDNNNDKKQLHDCGIIYYPQNPYLLCIMTRGNDMDKLESIVSEISRMVYEEFDSRKE